MSRKTLGRALLLTLSLLGLMSLAAATAFGAGKPTEVSAGYVTSSSSLNYSTIEGKANPNGLATTLTFQYAQITGGVQEEWHTFKTVEIGAGKTRVSATAKISGLKPFSKDAYQVIAQNSSGSVTASAKAERRVKVTGKAVHVVSYATAGTWAYTMSGSVQIQCAENGYGKMGSESGAEDYYHANLTECGVYWGGVKHCNHAPLEYTLNGSFKATTSSINTSLCTKEEGEVAVLLGNPFDVTVPNYQKFSVNNSMNMLTVNGTTSVASTLSAHLTGEDLNQTWGFEMGEEI